MLTKIKAVDKKRGKLNGILTNDFRNLAEKKLGQLDTATSFMYLFRRFGAPRQDNSDDHKILYSYMFEFEDIVIKIHASYHEHVYFNFFIPDHCFSKIREESIKFSEKPLTESVDKNYVFMPYPSLFMSNSVIVNKKLLDKNIALLENEMRNYYPDEKKYKFIVKQINGSKKSNNDKSAMFELLEQFEKYLNKKFNKSLSKEELKQIKKYNMIPKLKDFPPIRKQALEIIREFKKGVYVRDVCINIRGYESGQNKIRQFAE